jgi:hypothetical protein
MAATLAMACSSSTGPGAASSKSDAGARARRDSGTRDAAPGDAGGKADAAPATDAGDAGETAHPIALPQGAPGIAFDDLRWAPGIGKILAPGGRSGNLDLVDPETLDVTPVAGFSTSAAFSAGSHDSGTTSAVEAGAVLVALDHESQSVKVVDPQKRTITASAAVGAAPDYVRFVKATGEIWVTEPLTGIEVFSLPAQAAPKHQATIDVSGGPEALEVDETRGRAYTNSFTGNTYAVDIAKRKVVETWPNGCSISLGLALDEARGYVFVACQSGSIVVLDAAHGGTKLGELKQGAGLDILSYDSELHHLYVQGATSADLGIVAVSADGKPALLGAVPTAGSSTSATDQHGHVFVADPPAGGLIRVADTYPKTE